MKKILILLSFSLFFSIFTADFASAAYKRKTVTSTKATMSGLSVYSFKYMVVYEEQYNSISTTNNSVTYRDAYLHVDRRTPAVASASSGTKIYNGSTYVSESGLFSRYYPTQIVPGNTQNLNYRNFAIRNVRKGTGKSTNTSTIILSCSTYAPCIFNQNVTLTY